MILSYILGFVCAVFVLVLFSNQYLKRRVKSGKFASASYNDKEKRWEVNGQFSGIAQKLSDIRSGRQPGAIKYVD